ncbi:DMT family transporter [Albidovulum sediminicola]|uniref:DMT family transporter n=1 Tax=Albidovulum sediminicola TaxID=2984331 RepID=A0ABT2YYV6_9RHOB|nr:DMT family transporter [Defluviimonas sp. WL0075]MCV2864036.1 DMT family transporter [Defluviimonas sp. WL0075]
MPLRYWGLIVILGIGWGSSMFFNEILLRELGPLQVALGRVGLGALGCWAWVLATRRKVRVTLPFLRDVTVFGFLQYAAPLAIFPAAQRLITSGEAGIVNAMTPILVVIISHLWPGGERATVYKTLGVLCGFSGILMLALPALDTGLTGQFGALLFCVLAPVCYGIAINWYRRFKGHDATAVTACGLLAGTILLVPVALAVEGVPVIRRAETWGALFFIGFVLTAAAFIVIFWLLPRIGATATSTVTFITPVSAVTLGAVFLGEALGAAHFLGMAAIFLGLVLIDGRLLRRVFPTAAAT